MVLLVSMTISLGSKSKEGGSDGAAGSSREGEEAGLWKSSS